MNAFADAIAANVLMAYERLEGNQVIGGDIGGQRWSFYIRRQEEMADVEPERVFALAIAATTSVPSAPFETGIIDLLSPGPAVWQPYEPFRNPPGTASGRLG